MANMQQKIVCLFLSTHELFSASCSQLRAIFLKALVVQNSFLVLFLLWYSLYKVKQYSHLNFFLQNLSLIIKRLKTVFEKNIQLYTLVSSVWLEK